jgi:hypothetical protein
MVTSKEFFSRINVEQPDKKYFKSLIDCVASDYVFNRLAWVDKKDTETEKLQELPWWPDYSLKHAEHKTPEIALCEEFYNEYLDPCWVKIKVMVNDCLIKHPDKDSKWKIWYSRELADSLMFEEGIDYRVYEWMRITDNGKREL